MRYENPLCMAEDAGAADLGMSVRSQSMRGTGCAIANLRKLIRQRKGPDGHVM
jgi:hypothetical protein